MEEQGANSRMFFKNKHPPSKPQIEEDGIYCNLEKKALKSASNKGNKKILVVVCVLLLVSIAVLIYLAITMTNQSQDLSRQSDSLNWTLGVIMMFNNFPVNSFCPLKQCQPCLSGWILFKDHCYFFFNETSSWKQWDKSQTYCKDLNPISDLVVIESLEEQEFIYNHTQSYFDKFHGFWIGLSQIANNNWVWVDGQTDTLKFWMKKDLGKPGPKALMIPNQPLTESWSPAENVRAKFICESKALIKV